MRSELFSLVYTLHLDHSCPLYPDRDGAAHAQAHARVVRPLPRCGRYPAETDCRHVAVPAQANP
jgi:hypothetical protein